MSDKVDHPIWLDDADRRGAAVIEEARRLQELAKRQRVGQRPPVFGRRPQDLM